MLDLRPPLRPLFQVQYGHCVNVLPLIHGERVYLRDAKAMIGADATGHTLWRNPKLYFPRVMWNGRIVAERRRKLDSLGLDIISPETGDVLAFVDKPNLTEMTVVGGRLICHSYADRFVGALEDHGDREFTWAWRVRAEVQKGVLCADADGVYVGLTTGEVLAISLQNGKELWRGTVADLPAGFGSTNGSRAQGAPVCTQGLAIFEVGLNHIAAFRVATGERAWVWAGKRGVWQSQFTGGQYHILCGDSLVALDLITGQPLSTVDLSRTLPKNIGARPARPLLVSRTHVFTGSEAGRVLAFEKDRGKYVWSYQPDGAASTAYDISRFLAADGRLYYADMSFRMYCLEQADDAVGQEAERQAAMPEAVSPRLGFSVSASADSERGNTLVCRTPDGGTFFVAVDAGRGETNDPTPSFGRGAMWVAGPRDGQSLLKTARSAFAGTSIRGASRFAAGEPRSFQIVTFSDQDDQHPGPGWVRTKWFSEEVGCEVLSRLVVD